MARGGLGMPTLAVGPERQRGAWGGECEHGTRIRVFVASASVVRRCRGRGCRVESGQPTRAPRVRMFDQYTINGVFDEMFEEPQRPRPHYAPVLERVFSLGPATIQRRRHLADLSFRNLGITFTVYSDQASGVERIF